MFTRFFKSLTLITLILCLFVGLTMWSQTPVAADSHITLPPGFQADLVLDDHPLSTEISGLAVGHFGELIVADIGDAFSYGDEVFMYLEWDPFTVTVVETGLPMGSPARMAVGNGHPLIGDDLVLADWNSNETSGCCNGRVFQVNHWLGDFTTLAVGNPAYPPPGDPFGVAIGQGGAFGDDIYVMDFEGASPHPPVLYRIHADGSQSVVATDPAVWTVNRRPTDIAIDPGSGFGGDLYVVDAISPPTIWQVNAAGVISSLLSGAPLREPAALAFAPGGAFGTDLYVFDDANGTIYTVTPTGDVSVFATGLPENAPHSITPDIAFTPDGATLFVGSGDTLIRIDAAPVTWADLDAAIAEAEIDKESMRQGLQARGDAACAAYEAGDMQLSGKNLCAILRMLETEKGMAHIDPASAERIRLTAVRLADTLGIPLNCLAQ